MHLYVNASLRTFLRFSVYTSALTFPSLTYSPTHFVLAGKSRTEDVKVLSSKLKAAEVKISEQDVSIKQLEDTVATMKKVNITVHFVCIL